MAFMQSCQDATLRMEDVLFSTGGAHRIVAMLRYFKDQPDVQELTHTRDVLATNGPDVATGKLYNSKEENYTLSLSMV